MRAVLLAVLIVLAACSAADTTQTEVTETDLDPELHGMEVAQTPNIPYAQQGVETTAEMVTYFGDVQGYYAQPAAAGDYPGVVMIHEWWGLNDNIKAMADVLAAQGYRVLAVDLYDGKVAENFEQAREYVSSFDQEAGVENMEAAVAYLEEQGAERIASLGWCFGGARSLNLAQNAELDASVIYYGNLATDAESLASVDEPILGIFGSEDQGIPVSDVQAFEAQLNEQGTTNNINIYEGADHAFANPSGDRYDADAAEDAWMKTTAFLREQLYAPEPEGQTSQATGDAAAQEQPEVVEITMTGDNYNFYVDGETNPTITVNEGDTVRITFESVGGLHDVVIDEFDAATERVRPDDGVTTVEFVADQTGTFEYYCSVGNHRAQGMVADLVVE